MAEHSRSAYLAIDRYRAAGEDAEYFVNDGHGFHSNDARGTVTAKAPHDAVTCVGAVGERGQFVRPTSF
ncbi:MAG: hypothetical protein JF606_20905 [Burkholderiales bacterium]|nr:hypothetical protein [Burkholderiales bacterium]